MGAKRFEYCMYVRKAVILNLKWVPKLTSLGASSAGRA